VRPCNNVAKGFSAPAGVATATDKDPPTPTRDSDADADAAETNTAMEEMWAGQVTHLAVVLFGAGVVV
jgi:hypothetical protein